MVRPVYWANAGMVLRWYDDTLKLMDSGSNVQRIHTSLNTIWGLRETRVQAWGFRVQRVQGFRV